jgi:hypothetical protein
MVTSEQLKELLSETFENVQIENCDIDREWIEVEDEYGFKRIPSDVFTITVTCK